MERLILAVFITLVIGLSPAAASQNLNHVSCVYYHFDSGWIFYGWTSGLAEFNLQDGEYKDLVGFWTSERPEQNYAVCSAMIGTTSDEIVKIRAAKFQGKVISSIKENCVVEGAEVVRVSEDMLPLRRGSYVDLQSDWLISPGPNKISIRTYLPHTDEVDRLKDIAVQKCTEIAP